MPEQYNILIEHCNNVKRAEVSITRGALNIKYGQNGLGKSTIARAIVSQILNDGSIQTLTPFKLRDQDGAPTPSVDGVNDFKSALVFDETYVNQFVFQQDEVVRNSFNIFINTPDYQVTLSEIDTLLSGIRNSFANNAEIDQILKDLRELRDAFGTPTKGGGLPKTARIIKAFGQGNKIENVPDQLRPYEVYLKSEDPAKWIGWQIKGKEFLTLTEACPYCSAKFENTDRKKTILSVAEEYDATAVNHLNNLKSIIDRLGKYFSESCRDTLARITGSQVKLPPEGEQFLTQLQASLDLLIRRIEGLTSLSFFALRDVDAIKDKVGELRIELTLMDKLDSEDTRSVVDPINAEIDGLVDRVGELKGCIARHKRRIENAIHENQLSINSFLQSAGYKYSVSIIQEENSYKMKLVHEDLDDHIEMAARHLSYGEKNAFALVLFMHQVNSEKPDLVVLDDPISSFDKNKKFAILKELFHGKATLRDYTTIMLTHDIEPAIDIVRGVSQMFKGSSPSASHLASKGGVVTEVPIQRSDIQTFAQICRENVATITDPLIKCIYLRRHYEIIDDLGLEYNLLASLFKKRPTPTIQAAGVESREMTPDERSKAEGNIRVHISSFDYDALIKELNDEASMKAKFNSTIVGYEKVQLFRLIIGNHENEVVRKFINEAFHIENEYVMQLNPHKFDSVPEYVIDECTRIIAHNGAG